MTVATKQGIFLMPLYNFGTTLIRPKYNCYRGYLYQNVLSLIAIPLSSEVEVQNVKRKNLYC